MTFCCFQGDAVEFLNMTECKRISNGYPTEKPVETSRRLIVQSSDEGDLIVDPFMGSGSVGEAALRNGRHFVGNDLSLKSLEITEKRMSQIGDT